MPDFPISSPEDTASKGNKFRVTDPNGKQFIVTAPQGKTADDALAYFKQNYKPEAAAPTEAASQAEAPRSGISDFFKSIPRGVVGGLVGAASALGQAEAGQMGMEGVPGKERAMELVASGLPKPQGLPGRFGAAIGEAVGSPTSYLGPGGIARSLLSGIGGAVGAQAGGEVAGTPGAIAGGLVGGAAGGYKPRAPTPIITSAAQHKASAEAMYKQASNANAPIPTNFTGGLYNKIIGDFTRQGLYKEDAQGTFRQLDRLVMGSGIGHTGMSSSNELYSIKERLDEIANAAGRGAEATAARQASREIKDILKQIPGVGAAQEQADKHYAAFAQSEKITQAIKDAGDAAATTVRGETFPVALRREARKLLDDKYMKSQPPEVREILQSVVGPTHGPQGRRMQIINMARSASRLGRDHPWASKLIQAILAVKTGGYTMIYPVIRHVMKEAHGQIAQSRLERADEIIRNMGPLPKRPYDLTGPAFGAARGAATAPNIYEGSQ